MRHSDFTLQAYKKQTRCWWEVASLEMYIKEQLTVRGLRIMITPHSHTQNPDFMAGWDKLQTENTLKTMQYLLDSGRSQFEELNRANQHPPV